MIHAASFKLDPRSAGFIFILFIFISIIFLTGCSKPSSDIAVKPPSTDKQITSFTLTRPDGTEFDPQEFAVTVNPDSVKIILPPLTNRNQLKATLQYSGQSVTPASGSVQNFSAPVIYTVTAHDGTTKKYTIDAGYGRPVNVLFIGAGKIPKP